MALYVPSFKGMKGNQGFKKAAGVMYGWILMGKWRVTGRRQMTEHCVCHVIVFRFYSVKVSSSSVRGGVRRQRFFVHAGDLWT